MMTMMTIFCSTMFRFIVTAAHCVRMTGERVLVKIGEKVLAGAVLLPTKYSSVTHGWDVALVRLDTDISFSSYGGRVGPVCLAKRGLYNNNMATATGWGVTQEGGQKVEYHTS